jgi:hypothetical protein
MFSECSLNLVFDVYDRKKKIERELRYRWLLRPTKVCYISENTKKKPKNFKPKKNLEQIP